MKGFQKNEIYFLLHLTGEILWKDRWQNPKKLS